MQKAIDALVTDKTLNSSKLFTSADAAAQEVLDAVTPISEKYGLEAGGNILKNGKYYSYTTPVIGGEGSVGVATHSMGYHTHPSGKLMFSNRTNNFSRSSSGGDSSWVETSQQQLYLGVMSAGAVQVGVCNPGNCSHIGFYGTSPSRVVQ